MATHLESSLQETNKRKTQTKKTPSREKKRHLRTEIAGAVNKSKMPLRWQHPLHSTPHLSFSKRAQWKCFHPETAKQYLKFHKENWWATSRYLTTRIIGLITYMCMHKLIPVFILTAFNLFWLVCFYNRNASNYLLFKTTSLIRYICETEKLFPLPEQNSP